MIESVEFFFAPFPKKVDAIVLTSGRIKIVEVGVWFYILTYFLSFSLPVHSGLNVETEINHGYNKRQPNYATSTFDCNNK